MKKYLYLAFALALTTLNTPTFAQDEGAPAGGGGGDMCAAAEVSETEVDILARDGESGPVGKVVDDMAAAGEDCAAKLAAGKKAYVDANVKMAAEIAAGANSVKAFKTQFPNVAEPADVGTNIEFLSKEYLVANPASQKCGKYPVVLEDGSPNPEYATCKMGRLDAEFPADQCSDEQLQKLVAKSVEEQKDLDDHNAKLGTAVTAMRTAACGGGGDAAGGALTGGDQPQQ